MTQEQLAAAKIAFADLHADRVQLDDIGQHYEHLIQMLTGTRTPRLSSAPKNGAPLQEPAYSHRRCPAVPVAESITADAIICLEDGKRLCMLKRYLRTQYGMSPQEYRRRWNLPPDYPMNAPNLSAQRRALARLRGLGRHDRSRQTPNP